MIKRNTIALITLLFSLSGSYDPSTNSELAKERGTEYRTLMIDKAIKKYAFDSGSRMLIIINGSMEFGRAARVSAI